jgi:hypothetical protein
LEKEPYIRRHRLCAQLHFTLCQERGGGVILSYKEHWYELLLKSVETSPEGKVTILWNQQVQNGGTTPNHKPDIIIRDNEKGTCMLIDVAISGDRNVVKKESEKILKYTNFTIAIEPMWIVKTKVRPV